MTEKLFEELEKLSNNKQDPFDRIVAEWSKGPQPELYGKTLRAMVMALPVMLAHIQSWVEAGDAPAPLRRLHEYALAYIDNPIDYLPEKVMGLFGYVDDAYLVASVYNRTMQKTDWAGIKPYLNSPNLANDVPSWLAATQRLLPEVAGNIDKALAPLMAPVDAP